MEKGKRTHRRYDLDFKFTVLTDYYQSGESKNFIAKKYNIDHTNIISWEKQYALDEKDLNLSVELCRKLESMRKAQKQKESSTRKKTREEELQEEILKLRRALEYSELRNEALHEVLKIGKEEYGVDLLKKAGAKQ